MRDNCQLSLNSKWHEMLWDRLDSNLLQKVGYGLSFWTFEATGQEKLLHVFQRTVVYDVPGREQNDIVEQFISLRCWLQQRDRNRRPKDSCSLTNALHDLISCRAVQTGRDFVHEQSPRRPHNHLPCARTSHSFVSTVIHMYWSSPSQHWFYDLWKEIQSWYIIVQCKQIMR